jgi:hypothetical protein
LEQLAGRVRQLVPHVAAEGAHLVGAGDAVRLKPEVIFFNFLAEYIGNFDSNNSNVCTKIIIYDVSRKSLIYILCREVVKIATKIIGTLS